MPDIKEKPQMGKPKAKDRAAMLPKQSARLMKEKYLQQVDQRPEQADVGNGDATQQVEGAGRWAVDELAVASRHPGPRQRPKGKPHTTTGQPPTTPVPEPPANIPKERQAAEHKNMGQRPASKERPNPRTPKERPPQNRTPPSTRYAAPKPSDSTPPPSRSAQPRQAQRQFALNNRRCGLSASHQLPESTGTRSAQNFPDGGPDLSNRAPGRGAGAIKERTQAAKSAIKSRPTTRAAAKAGRVMPKLRPTAPPSTARAATRKARQRIQQQVSRVMNTQAAKAVKTAVAATKRVAVAVVKAVAALVGAVAGIAGGGILLVALVIVIIIAAVANSPFGLFFAEEKNAPDTVSVAEAVSTVNMAYNAKLEELQAGDYDSIVIQGQAADWPDVLAVFAVKTAGADVDGMDVATLDADRVDKLTAVFWDMTAITSYVETIHHSGSGEDDPGWTEYILHITITPKTADDIRPAYGFTNYQNTALDELLADRGLLSALAGSLTITNADVSAVLDALPADLSTERREAVHIALQLVGKVNYFWGGKSAVIGWDSRWGTLQKVWAAGNSTTGTYRPYGLDCSGFVDWIFNNAMGYVIGHGGGVIMQHTYCTDIPWSEAQPGDLAFFLDDSHIGIVVGRGADGGILVCHCSSGQNNVVVTDCAATGFTAIGRPDIFD